MCAGNAFLVLQTESGTINGSYFSRPTAVIGFHPVEGWCEVKQLLMGSGLQGDADFGSGRSDGRLTANDIRLGGNWRRVGAPPVVALPLVS